MAKILKRTEVEFVHFAADGTIKDRGIDVHEEIVDETAGAE